jgi:hypothetical protein
MSKGAMSKDRDQVSQSTVLRGRIATQTDADARGTLPRLGCAKWLLIRTSDVLMRPMVSWRRLAFTWPFLADRSNKPLGCVRRRRFITPARSARPAGSTAFGA